MDDIKKYVNDFGEVADFCQIYLDKVEELGFSGSQPLLFELATKHIQNLAIKGPLTLKLFGEIAQTKDKIKLPFELYFNMKESIFILSDLLRIYLDNQISYKHMGATTSGSTVTKELVDELLSDLDKIEISILRVIAEFEDLEMEKRLSIVIIPNISKEEELKILTDVYKNYFPDNGKYVVDLYCEILNSILSKGTSQKMAAMISVQIEELKTNILQTRKWDDLNRSENTIQLLIQRNRLVPDCELTPLPELILRYFGVKTKTEDTEKMLMGAAKSIGIGFIVIYKLCGTIEHRIQSILGEDIAKMQPKSGVNGEFIKITQTIRRIEVSPKDTKNLKIKISKIPQDVDYYYILESLDNTNFRLMRMWNKTNKNAILYIPKERVLNIGNSTKTPSIRLSNYNEIINEELAKNIQQPTFKEMEKPTANRWQIIREKIIIKVSEFYLEKLRKIILPDEKSKSKNIKDQVIKLLKSGKIISKILGAIVELIITSLSKNFKNWDSLDKLVRDQLKEEITVSYLGDLDYMQYRLKTEIEENYKQNEKEFSDIMENNKDLSLVSKLSTIINKILEQSLKTFIDTTTSIFTNIENKLQILDNNLIKII